MKRTLRLAILVAFVLVVLTVAQIFGRDLGTVLRAVASRLSTAHAVAPSDTPATARGIVPSATPKHYEDFDIRADHQRSLAMLPPSSSQPRAEMVNEAAQFQQPIRAPFCAGVRSRTRPAA